MEHTQLTARIKKVLRTDDRVWDTAGTETELNYTRLFHLLQEIDPDIIDLLFQDSVIQEKFFVKTKNAVVFKHNDFRFFMEENKIDNSYTIYKNRIGLTDGKKFLQDSTDIVLDFPYKDCVLEGGQSTEEGTDIYFVAADDGNYPKAPPAKRKEIFFNTILAHDEIDRLLDPKALVNWTRYTKDGKQEVTKLHRDANGTITENLIIKGNNLLALHSLKQQFAGKVKLIYIDPPYNTGNDGFKYNDSFNHSTWLTFMKNRLEVARTLLRDDGVIFVQCDDNEQAYLKVLMDDIFGRDNFVVSLPRVTKKAGKSTDLISKNNDLILCYYKKNILLNKLKINEEDYPLRDDYFSERGGHKLSQPLDYNSLQYNKTMDYEVVIGDRKFYPGGFNLFKERKNGNFSKIDWVWRWGQEKLRFGLKNNFIELKNNRIYTKTYSNATISKQAGKYFIEIVKRTKNITSLDFVLDNAYSNDNSTKHIAKIFDDKNTFGYSKPEKLLQRIIEIATQPNDIILDFHLGSGTTATAAHKMGRQYIGIEQMDYIEPIAVERLKKVIAGEQGGISSAVAWKGGGQFIYCQLAKHNETAKEQIRACTNLLELEAFFDTMQRTYFLNYNLKIKEFTEKIIKEPSFKELRLHEQKEIFIAMLDNNQAYISATEMADKKFNISPTDQTLTAQFYQQ